MGKARPPRPVQAHVRVSITFSDSRIIMKIDYYRIRNARWPLSFDRRVLYATLPADPAASSHVRVVRVVVRWMVLRTDGGGPYVRVPRRSASGDSDCGLCAELCTLTIYDELCNLCTVRGTHSSTPHQGQSISKHLTR